MSLRIVIAGAGSIGCFVGALLADAGHDVTLLGRPRVFDEIRAHGLSATDFAGLACRPDADRLTLSQAPACLAGADVILVTVKTAATTGIADRIAEYSPVTAPVISLQNGLAAIASLRAALPDRDLRAGMVPFNVVPMGQGRYHRATSGDIVIGAGPGDLARRLAVPGLAIAEADDMAKVQWGKVLVNLNNALNALSGMRLLEQLMHRDWRCLMADQMAEALAVLRAAGQPVRSMTPLPAELVPHLLRLPTPLFRRIAARMLTIDPTARTSMAHDLLAGRPTEVAAFQGAICELGARHGVATPINARVMALIRVAEASGGAALSVAQIRG